MEARMNIPERGFHPIFIAIPVSLAIVVGVLLVMSARTNDKVEERAMAAKAPAAASEKPAPAPEQPR
jgi:hypothetical protein